MAALLPEMTGPNGSLEVSSLQWRGGVGQGGIRAIPDETAVALVHDASTTAVMMATCADLEDFGVGFSFTEGIVSRSSEIRDLEVIEGHDGVEVRMWLSPDRSAWLAGRRRLLTGSTGCGLCGVESLAQAVRDLPRVDGDIQISAGQVASAVSALSPLQPLGAATRATHAAGLWTTERGMIAVREDVGRHNALDKLVGATVRAGEDATRGVVVLTSRVSVEMVQKAAMLGAPILVAISAPTALAVRTAEACGLTLAAVARADGFEVFAHPHRIMG
jgi:FdhD protein